MSIPSDLAIETRGLTKRYASAQALAGVDLHVPTGSVYGFLGRNGAGETTTIKTLMGMVRPSGGEGHVLRHSIADERAGGDTPADSACGRGPQPLARHDGRSGPANLAAVLPALANGP
jgi:ABC-2 type transport system ATP-binding protein